jgi:hypothetical protein
MRVLVNSPLPSFGCTYVIHNSSWGWPSPLNFFMVLLIGLRAFLRRTPGSMLFCGGCESG